MRIKEGFQLRDICGNKTIIASGEQNIDFNSLVALNESGAYLWEEAVKGDFDEGTLAAHLRKEYDVDEEVALADVRQLIDEWKKLGMVEG